MPQRVEQVQRIIVADPIAVANEPGHVPAGVAGQYHVSKGTMALGG